MTALRLPCRRCVPRSARTQPTGHLWHGQPIRCSHHWRGHYWLGYRLWSGPTGLADPERWPTGNSRTRFHEQLGCYCTEPLLDPRRLGSGVGGDPVLGRLARPYRDWGSCRNGWIPANRGFGTENRC